MLFCSSGITVLEHQQFVVLNYVSVCSYCKITVLSDEVKYKQFVVILVYLIIFSSFKILNVAQ